MKQNVKLSTYSLILTCLSIVIIGGLLINQINHGFSLKAYFLVALLALICLLSLFYSPVYISVDKGCLNIHRSLRTRSIPLSEIESVELVSPTMSEKRICGSGGWFGYWGWMSEPSLGKYFAYYGKASDCFLVRLKDGQQYMLGCTDPGSMVEAINRKIA